MPASVARVASSRSRGQTENSDATGPVDQKQDHGERDPGRRQATDRAPRSPLNSMRPRRDREPEHESEIEPGADRGREREADLRERGHVEEQRP